MHLVGVHSPATTMHPNGGCDRGIWRCHFLGAMRDLVPNTLETFCTDPLCDPHIARSEELIELGDHVAADRVRLCGAVNAWPRTRYCHRRDCPSCAEYLSTRYSARVLEGVRSFRGHAILVGLFAVTVRLSALGSGFKLFRRSLGLLRRRQVMKLFVLGGAGALEPKLVANRCWWNLHAHVLLDVDGGQLPEADIGRQWRELTGGTFSLDPEHPSVRSTTGFSKYSTKTDSWAPRPGQLTTSELAHHREGIRGRQLVICWGTARRGGAR